MASNIPNTPPHGPLGKKNSASSRPVAYPPPMTTALKAKPGSRKRLKNDGGAGKGRRFVHGGQYVVRNDIR
jgi:hypothetical protein